MNRICENKTFIQEIKKSKFITKLYYVTTLEEIKYYLEETKKEYRDATHYCYAYIIENERKFSDDKEPGGTAGSPMMEVLNKRKLNNILCIVIRYFGGIKLGAGGLVRAYSSSVSKALDQTKTKELVPGYQILIKTDYKNENKILQIIGKENIIKKEYLENLEIEGVIQQEKLKELDLFYIEIIQDIWI